MQSTYEQPKEDSHDHISWFRKFNTCLWWKTFRKLRIEGNFLNSIEDIHKKDTTNMLHSERLNVFPPSHRGTKKGCPLPQVLFNIILEVLASALGQENEIKSRLIREKLNCICRWYHLHRKLRNLPHPLPQETNKQTNMN